MQVAARATPAGAETEEAARRARDPIDEHFGWKWPGVVNLGRTPLERGHSLPVIAFRDSAHPRCRSLEREMAAVEELVLAIPESSRGHRRAASGPLRAFSFRAAAADGAGSERLRGLYEEAKNARSRACSAMVVTSDNQAMSWDSSANIRRRPCSPLSEINRLI